MCLLSVPFWLQLCNLWGSLGPKGEEIDYIVDNSCSGPGSSLGVLKSSVIHMGRIWEALRKNGFLLKSWPDEVVDGGDAGGAQEVSVRSFVQRSDSDSEEFSELGFSLDELILNEAVNGGVVSEEFLLNQVGTMLQEYFQNEFDSFMGSLPPQ